MKKPFPKMILRILLVCVLLLGFLYMDDDIGTSAANLESDIRNLQKIPEDWIVEGDVSDTMAAYISYPQDLSLIHISMRTTCTTARCTAPTFPFLRAASWQAFSARPTSTPPAAR